MLCNLRKSKRLPDNFSNDKRIPEQNMQAIWAKGNNSTELKMVKKQDHCMASAFAALRQARLYFQKEKLTMFVDGCFWHRCPKCYREPKINTEF